MLNEKSNGENLHDMNVAQYIRRFSIPFVCNVPEPAYQFKAITKQSWSISGQEAWLRAWRSKSAQNFRVHNLAIALELYWVDLDRKHQALRHLDGFGASLFSILLERFGEDVLRDILYYYFAYMPRTKTRRNRFLYLLKRIFGKTPLYEKLNTQGCFQADTKQMYEMLRQTYPTLNFDERRHAFSQAIGIEIAPYSQFMALVWNEGLRAFMRFWAGRFASLTKPLSKGDFVNIHQRFVDVLARGYYRGGLAIWPKHSSEWVQDLFGIYASKPQYTMSAYEKQALQCMLAVFVGKRWVRDYFELIAVFGEKTPKKVEDFAAQRKPVQFIAPIRSSKKREEVTAADLRKDTQVSPRSTQELPKHKITLIGDPTPMEHPIPEKSVVQANQRNKSTVISARQANISVAKETTGGQASFDAQSIVSLIDYLHTYMDKYIPDDEKLQHRQKWLYRRPVWFRLFKQKRWEVKRIYVPRRILNNSRDAVQIHQFCNRVGIPWGLIYTYEDRSYNVTIQGMFDRIWELYGMSNQGYLNFALWGSNSWKNVNNIEDLRKFKLFMNLPYTSVWEEKLSYKIQQYRSGKKGLID